MLEVQEAFVRSEIIVRDKYSFVCTVAVCRCRFYPVAVLGRYGFADQIHSGVVFLGVFPSLGFDHYAAQLQLLRSQKDTAVHIALFVRTQ